MYVRLVHPSIFFFWISFPFDEILNNFAPSDPAHSLAKQSLNIVLIIPQLCDNRLFVKVSIEAEGRLGSCSPALGPPKLPSSYFLIGDNSSLDRSEGKRSSGLVGARTICTSVLSVNYPVSCSMHEMNMPSRCIPWT